MKASIFALLAALLTVGYAHAASIADGPYVDGQGRARWVEGDDTSPQIREQAVGVGKSITVPAAGTVPAFQVRLRKPEPIAPDTVALPKGRPLFVVADIHGELEILVQLLQAHQIVDSSLRWSYGRGYVAFLGDVFDRGPHHTEVLWLIYKLEDEARRAGGRVLMTLGNHESMILLGDLRYLNDKYPKVAQALGAASYSELWNERSVLGQWLRSKPVMMKVGDSLCMHGGVSPELTQRGLAMKDINATVRNVLLGKLAEAGEAERQTAAFVTKGPASPLWYRGYFPDAAASSHSTVATDEDVSRSLEHFAARTIVVGHTIVPTVTALYGGKVIAVQVYPHIDKQSHAAVMEAAVQRAGVWYRARIEGSTEPLLQGPALSWR